MNVAHEFLRLLFEYGYARFDVGRLNVCDKTPLEPAAQALLEVGDLRGRAVGREHELFAGVVQVVEGMEQLFLRALLAGDELNVVDHEHGGGTVFVAERVLRLLAVAYGRDEFVEKLLAGHVDYFLFGVGHEQRIAYVRFALLHHHHQQAI